jgi:dipeptide transport system ATP-binding protein
VVPGQFDRPSGCLFSPRCKFADAKCKATPPPPLGADLGFARCFHPVNSDERIAS